MDEDDDALDSGPLINSSLANWFFPITRSVGNLDPYFQHEFAIFQISQCLGNNFKFYGRQNNKRVSGLGIKYII